VIFERSALPARKAIEAVLTLIGLGSATIPASRGDATPKRVVDAYGEWFALSPSTG